MADERRVYPDCINSSNQYHECVEYCVIKIAESKARIKKENPVDECDELREADPEFYREASSLQNLKAQKISEMVKKLKDRDEKCKPFSRRRKFHEEKDTDSINDRNEHFNKKIERAFGKYTLEITSDHAVKSINFTFSGISYATEASDKEDVRASISDSCVLVGKYHVRANAASLLEMILEKYGDIAANCRLESVSLRGFYLECLCSVVQELQSIPFEKLTKSKIKEMLAVLKDVESANIDVTWLYGILSELTEAMDIKATEAAKANCDKLVESKKKELETMIQDLADKEKAVAEANEQIAETRRQLIDIELEASQLSNAILSIQPKIEKFRAKPLLEEIF